VLELKAESRIQGALSLASYRRILRCCEARLILGFTRYHAAEYTMCNVVVSRVVLELLIPTLSVTLQQAGRTSASCMYAKSASLDALRTNATESGRPMSQCAPLVRLFASCNQAKSTVRKSADDATVQTYQAQRPGGAARPTHRVSLAH
jgi:hypothetical protein